MIRVYLVFALFAVLVFPPKAYAYLDPGTGSYFFQMLIGVAIGGLVGIKLFWKKIKDFFNAKKED